MATNDDITSCTVCFEDFDLAVHVPRILPCLHSLCDVCLENLCRAPGRNHIQCPECRVQHKTDGSGAKKFPQNKYIISFLHQKQQNLSNASSPTYRRCPQHNLEMTLFCTEDDCNGEICSRCYLGEHKMHNVIDIDDEGEKQKKFVADINSIIEAGNEEIAQAKETVVDSYITEMQRLETVEQNALRLINSFVKSKKTEIAKNKQDGMKCLQTLKTVLDDAENKVSAPRINAHQAERLLYSVAVKIQRIQRAGIPTTSHRYGYSELHGFSGLDDKNPRRLKLSDLSSLDSSESYTKAFGVNILRRTGVKALEIGSIADPALIHVFVKTLSGETLDLKAKRDNTVGELKAKVCDLRGILVREQRLIFGGRQLEDRRTLDTYNIRAGSTITMVLRMCGD